jgi:hypothetical protein
MKKVSPDKTCQRCKGTIVIIESLYGYKALCKCSPRVWGLGKTQEIARDDLFRNMKEEK